MMAGIGTIAGIVAVGPALVWAAVLTGTYAAAYFLAVVEDTANGYDIVKWPQEGWKDLFWNLLYLIWIGIIGVLIPETALFVAGVPALVRSIFLVPLILSIVILSMMRGNSAWVIIHPGLLFDLVKRPVVLIALYLHCLVLWVIDVSPLLLFPNIGLYLIPVSAAVGAAGWLIYGRVLGRVLWTLEHGGGRKKWRRKRRRDVKYEEEEEY